MLKIRALNRESSSDEDFPVIRREAQEEIALEEYNKALRLQSTGHYDEAETILLNLINENVPQLENNGGLPHSMSTIKYSCHLNIGNIRLTNGKLNEALDNYIEASELDDTDVTLWYKIGNLAIKQNRFKQAAYALAKGLECSESHWPCLDQLISVLYAMKDTISCLLYIGRALNLDNNYVKGLVLRKQIYKDNPATLEYYQAYNPNHIWEPPVNIQIDAEEERVILEKEQKLCDRIRDFEKSLGPKSLQIIPLPKALIDFTWVSFGKTVTYLHQFLTDNNMSHFTMVDINRCMNHEDSSVDVAAAAAAVVTEEIVENIEKPPDDPVVDNKIENELDDEKMETEPIPERRPSQNSENNNDGQENTPIQTDNDEEQVIEQDGYDQEEIDNKSDKSKSLNTSKSNKRKRDLLSDLQIWGWHSKRKSAKKGKSDKDLTIEDALNRILPNSLLKNKVEEKFNSFEDSMNTMDIYNMYVENRHVNILSPIHSPKSVNLDEYFDTDREKADVKNVWLKERKYYDATILIKDFVVSLSKLWHTEWPKDLIKLYIDAYTMYREHYDHPQPFNDDFTFDELKEDALVTLLYGELINFSSTKSDTKFIHVTSLAFLQTISGWQDEWQDGYLTFFTRFYWLRCHIFRKEGNYDLAIQSLELIQEVISEEETKTGEKFFLYLPNCCKCGLITNEVTTKILKHLDMITSLNCLEELFANEKYQEVSDILKLTFNISSRPISGKMGRPAELALLLHSLWYTNLTECFIWTEECLHEALGHFLKPTDNYDKWEKFLHKCLEFLHEIIKMETVIIIDSLDEPRRARLVEILAKIICKQLNTENTSTLPLGTVTPWMLLHYILTREEHRQQACRRISHVKCEKNDDFNNIDANDDLPPSIAILFSAHEFLGPKGWCLVNNGELLHFMLDIVLDRLDTPVLENLREKVDIHIEQALFCLYQHPSKKNKISRHLADHNVDPLSLTWERAFQLYEFYGPDYLPEFNSYKTASISSDLEQLLQRIIALVPNECDPQTHISKLFDYIQGKLIELPESLTFPYKVRDIYYLIGDFYFKQREFSRCIKYFMMDLCINQIRVDSWACVGLSYIAQLESKLNYCKKFKTETEFLDKAKSAQISFRKALELAADHIMLWIEFGSFEYMVHSFCSRLLKTESDTLSMEKFEYLEAQKNSYLESSGRSFEKAIELYQPDENEADERWLQYYILGKVAEKQQKEPNEYLKYYATAGKLLHENNALYPDKINYHNPQHLSVEALEMHYRVNASILKYLELHEGKDIPNSLGNFFKQQLDKSYFPKKSLVKQSFPSNGSSARLIPTSQNEILDEVKKCLNDILDKIDEQQEDGKKFDRKNSVDECSDVIMISDSDDEQLKNNSEQNDRKNVQELFDKVREEAIKKSEEQEPDSDASTTTSKQITDNKSEGVKSDRTDNKLKSGSETDDIRTSIDESSSSSSSSSSSNSSSNSDSDDDSSSSSSSSSSEVTNRKMSQNEISSLIDRCIVGLEQCVIRLPQNYKALYRLAHLFFNYKSKRDLTKCRQLLLGEYTCKGGIVIAGLFADRKNHNFFNGIWRIPSSEIDRPGSLSAHMSRCIALLLQVLRATNDNKTLLDLSLQFRKTPDPDKIYIKDTERLQFADQAMAMCIQSLRSQMQNLSNMNDNAVERLLQDIYRSFQRLQKVDPAKEATFSSMLSELFRKWKKDIVTDNVNVLDLATKFCQQNRLVEKQKRQMQRQTAVLRGPTVPNTPVLPTPSSVTPTTQPPLKRPGMSRPRGRPPLPKIPGQNRPPKNRNLNVPTNLYPWSNSKFMQDAALNYLKQYQDELIKQYSQLNYTQLSQLNQYLTQNQLNTFAQNQFASQFLSNQNLLLNNPNVLKQIALGGYLPQLSDTTKSASGFKSTSDNLSMGSMAGLNADIMKNFPIDVIPSTSSKSSSSYKKHLPQTITQPSQSTGKTKSQPSSSAMFGANLPQTSANKPTKHEKKSTMPHTITSNVKSAFTTPYKTSYPSSVNLASVDSTKMKSRPSSSSSSKNTSDLQIFKEPTITKAHSHIQKSIEKAANILMKDRPNISITPVMSNTMTMPPFIPTSPGKTLQEKLADRQKQLSTKQLTKNIEAEIIAKDSSTAKKINIPSIPASLSPSSSSSSSAAAAAAGFKPSQLKFSLDSGISISQLPAAQSYKTTETMKHSPKTKSVREISTSSNLPISLSIAKKQPDKRKSSDDDDVICID